MANLSLREAADAIRVDRITAQALAAQCVERIRAHDSRVHAWAWFDADRMMAQAREADEFEAARGPLHGLPIAVKDVIWTRDIPTRLGSPIFADFVPAENAACVDRLEAAGAYVQGKTVTTEFAAQHPGPTTNPWDLRCTPGGSSSGSAAAVAAGFALAALGTQTRGSVIRPAAFCGIVGYKPSFGLISRYGVQPLAGSLDHVGVLARDIADAGWLVAQMAANDTRDPGSMPPGDLPAQLAGLSLPARAPRLAAVRSPAWPLADAAQQAHFEANCATLGGSVEYVDLPPIFERAPEVARTIQLYEVSVNFHEIYRRSREQMSATFCEWCEIGTRISKDEYRDMLGFRDAMRDQIAEILAAYDAIVTPPASGEAPATLLKTGDAAFCSLWTLCGLPCITIPTGVGPRGLPLGLQLVGRIFDDARLLEAAQWCARRLPFAASPEL